MKTVVAGALGECVHVAGVMNFLRLAEAAGWRTVFLGPAVPVGKMLRAARREKAALVGVSYRLTPETGERLMAEFAEEADDLRTAGVRFLLVQMTHRGRIVSHGVFRGAVLSDLSPESRFRFLPTIPGKMPEKRPKTGIDFFDALLASKQYMYQKPRRDTNGRASGRTSGSQVARRSNHRADRSRL